MTAPRIISAYEADALLRHGTDAELAAAAPDLAASVVALHAEVERAASAERARIVALLTEMAEATRGLDGRETVASFAYRSAILGVLELTP